MGPEKEWQPEDQETVDQVKEIGPVNDEGSSSQMKSAAEMDPYVCLSVFQMITNTYNSVPGQGPKVAEKRGLPKELGLAGQLEESPAKRSRKRTQVVKPALPVTRTLRSQGQTQMKSPGKKGGKVDGKKA